MRRSNKNRNEDIDLSIFNVDHIPHITDCDKGYIAFQGTKNETFFKRYSLARYFVRDIILKKRFKQNEPKSKILPTLTNHLI